jgi:hypothetical protein
MNYINPIEIMDLLHLETSSIDSSVIKKAKARLFAEIELSDEGAIDYKGVLVTKEDCENVINQIENRLFLEYYYYLASSQLLNNFLVSGNEEIFSAFKQESIYKDQGFINFINPLFAEKFDKAITKSFQNNDQKKFILILRGQCLLKNTDFDIAFKGIRKEIELRIEATNTLIDLIEKNESEYTNVNVIEVYEITAKSYPFELVNQLPIHFQSQINKVGSSINRLALVIWEEFKNSYVSLKLLEHLLQLNVDSASKPIFQKNLDHIKKLYLESENKKKYASSLEKWSNLLLELKSYKNKLEEQSESPGEIFGTIKQKIQIDDLNSLGDYAEEIRTSIAYSLRGLSISSWNKNDDVINALKFINLGLQIKNPEEVIKTLESDKSDLAAIEKKHAGVLVCFFCGQNPPKKGCELTKTIYKENSRSYFPRRSVQFSYKNVTVPRCSKCKEAHSGGDEIFYVILVICLILGGIIGALTEEQHFIVGGILGAIVGGVIGKVVESNKLDGKGIKGASSISSHPLVIDYIKQGWTFSKPSA